MKRASTSLPVPDSPTISTVQSLAATRRASSSRRCEIAAQATGCGSSARRALAATGCARCSPRTSRLPHTNGAAQGEWCKSRAWRKSPAKRAWRHTRRREAAAASVNLPSRLRIARRRCRACAASRRASCAADSAAARRGPPCRWSARSACSMRRRSMVVRCARRSMPAAGSARHATRSREWLPQRHRPLRRPRGRSSARRSTADSGSGAARRRALAARSASAMLRASHRPRPASAASRPDGSVAGRSRDLRRRVPHRRSTAAR